jgi:tripartite-type tricarboxylate transporter receptor subunit TctC
LVHVPYKGAGPALNDLIGSHVDMYFTGFPAAMPLVKAGTLKVLAVSSAQRSQAAPEIPTVAEITGIGDFDLTLWQGFFAPKGTPGEVIARLNSEINKILAEPEVRQRLIDAGANVVPLPLDAFATFVKNESEKYQRIITLTGVKSE